VSQPVYGSNDWYFRYGQNSHASILQDAAITAELAANAANPPYAVIDAGWQVGRSHEHDLDSGDRTRGNSAFPDMPGLAEAVKGLGARPGIWVRPLIAADGTPASRLLTPAEPAVYAHLPILDPSLPENLAEVEADMRRLSAWGYQLIKHDFSTVDILGRWGFEMGAQVTGGRWAFADRSRTTAEIIHSLYAAIRAGAGEDTLVIGCNTIGHLGAGLFDLQRTGDDTSGREWERTRKMGVNTLAFRMAQHNTFFQSDADCVGLTSAIPWALNAQWLDLLARSGTPLFVSADPDSLGPQQKTALSEAFALAACPQAPAEPVDWLDNVCPGLWNCQGEQRAYDWYLE
jgi:alpha-galactosidase